MIIRQAICIAKEMQLWRRSEGIYGEDNHAPMPYSSKKFGEAIDALINLAESNVEMEEELRRLVESLKKKSEE